MARRAPSIRIVFDGHDLFISMEGVGNHRQTRAQPNVDFAGTGMVVVDGPDYQYLTVGYEPAHA